MSRQKKMDMITAVNPNWQFLNIEICGEWPPKFEGRFLLNDKKQQAPQNNNEVNDDEWWIGLIPPPLEE